MNDNIHFLIDGSILRQVLTTLKSERECIDIDFSEDKIVLSTPTIYVKIPASILGQYNYVADMPKLSTHRGFEYATELPSKEGTDVSVDILPRVVEVEDHEEEEYDIKIVIPGHVRASMSTSFTIDGIVREHPTVTPSATIVVYDIKLFSQILRKSIGSFYVGAVGMEIRIGTRNDSYVAFPGEHRGDEVHTYVHRKLQKLKKMSFVGAESIIIDIDIEHNKMLYKWISNKVLYIALFPYHLS